MEYRNPVYNAFGTIDCEVNHPRLGWVPFTASPDDVVEIGQTIFAEASSSAAPYVPPAPPTIEDVRTAMAPISPRQLRLTLLSIDVTEAEVDAALANNPAGMIEWKYATVFHRAHPLLDSLAAGFSITPEQLDDLWAYAQTL